MSECVCGEGGGVSGCARAWVRQCMHARHGQRPILESIREAARGVKSRKNNNMQYFSLCWLVITFSQNRCTAKLYTESQMMQHLCDSLITHRANGHRDKFRCYPRFHDQGRSSGNFENLVPDFHKVV